jgi:hypothetical protein
MRHSRVIVLRIMPRALLAWACLGSAVLRADDNPVPAAPQRSVLAPSASASPQPRYQLDWKRPKPPSEPSEPRARYTGWLVASYLAVPLVIIGVPWAASELSTNRDMPVIAGISGLVLAMVLPATVHLAHEERDLGLRSLALFPALTAAGVVSGFLLGLAVGTQDLRHPHDDSLALEYAVVAGLVGGGVGCVVWAIVDILAMSSEPDLEARAQHSLRLAILPTHDGAFGSLTVHL